MKKGILNTRVRVELFYPEIRGFLNEEDDPDKAWDFLNICIMNGTITEGKAQKMFDRRFPKEALDNWRRYLTQTAIESDPEMERLKKEAIEKRREAIKNLGFSPEDFEKEMEKRLKEREATYTE